MDLFTSLSTFPLLPTTTFFKQTRYFKDLISVNGCVNTAKFIDNLSFFKTLKLQKIFILSLITFFKLLYSSSPPLPAQPVIKSIFCFLSGFPGCSMPRYSLVLQGRVIRCYRPILRLPWLNLLGGGYCRVTRNFFPFSVTFFFIFLNQFFI